MEFAKTTITLVGLLTSSIIANFTGFVSLDELYETGRFLIKMLLLVEYVGNMLVKFKGILLPLCVIINYSINLSIKIHPKKISLVLLMLICVILVRK